MEPDPFSPYPSPPGEWVTLANPLNGPMTYNQAVNQQIAEFMNNPNPHLFQEINPTQLENNQTLFGNNPTQYNNPNTTFTDFIDVSTTNSSVGNPSIEEDPAGSLPSIDSLSVNPPSTHSAVSPNPPSATPADAADAADAAANAADAAANAADAAEAVETA
jgi:hypothetical protein